MRFTPYPLLLTTGALMFATVMMAQTGPSVPLLKAGVHALNNDVSTLTARAERRDNPQLQSAYLAAHATRVALASPDSTGDSQALE